VVAGCWCPSGIIAFLPCCSSGLRPELQPAFFWNFYLPEPGLCWASGIAWIASFQAKSELVKNSNGALKPKLKQSNLFLRCSGWMFFCQLEMTGVCEFSQKPHQGFYEFGGFVFSFLGRETDRNPNTLSGERKWQSEPTHTERGKQGQDLGRPSRRVAGIYLRTSDSCWKSCSTFSVFLPPPASLFGFVALLLGCSEWQ